MFELHGHRQEDTRLFTVGLRLLWFLHVACFDHDISWGVLAFPFSSFDFLWNFLKRVLATFPPSDLNGKRIFSLALESYLGMDGNKKGLPRH